MTTTESTLTSPIHQGLDDVDAPEPMPRPRRRRRAALAVLGVAIALVAALLAGVLTGGGRATPRAAAEELDVDSPRFSTNEPGTETSSTVIERDGEPTARDDASTNAATEAAGGAPSTGDQADDGDAPQPPAGDPAHLDASTTSLAFGQHASQKTFTIENDGGAPMSWDAQESASWMSVSPTAGDLAAGASQVIEVTVTRAGMESGTPFQDDLTIASDGGETVVHVTGSAPFDMVQPVPAQIVSVNHLPMICSVNSPSGSKTTPIVAKVSGPDIDGVKLYWSLNDGPLSGIDMAKSGADTWMVPAFGNLPQGLVEIAVFVENQFGDDLVERQIVISYCP